MTDLSLRRTLSAPAALAAHRATAPEWPAFPATAPALRRTASAPAGLRARGASPAPQPGASLPPRAALLPRAASAPAALGASRVETDRPAGPAVERIGAPEHVATVPTVPTEAAETAETAETAAPRPSGSPWSAVRTASAWSAPVVDAAAAALSLASARLAAVPRAAQATAAVSGSLWAGAAMVGEVGNVPYRAWTTGANAFAVVAGGLSAAAPFTLGPAQRAIAYGSAGAWAASGAAMALGAVGTGATHAATGLLQGVSGIANLAAAGLSAAAVQASGRDAGQAVRLQTASSALWLAGSAAAVGAVWAKTAQPHREPLADPERG
ncbi:hypothetical protein AVME950_13835 [Acidovorax sp. SUPP950]|uniref:hypothetical protein n=1 Tax=Acidovorax sp. SUPP950 TaxID=511901 RepID=UPI0023D4CD8D|nr:hypothetical protein [Acidovorax sp. SUPP950]GKS75985.1 hypothetical protein AVME950_13835 [Acidovorax sp. SUPP950]